MRIIGRFFVMAVLAVAVTACNPDRKTPDQCASDGDCTPFFCFQGVCVQCSRDEQCDRHRICGSTQCVLLGAENENQTLNAHGNWRGTPGQADYEPTGTCSSDADCDFGEICNPFTAGCIKAADFQDACGINNNCDTSVGPNGEVTACEPVGDKCLPAPLCAADRNCEGYEDFVCDPSGVCQYLQLDCQPPPDIPDPPPCPFMPQLTDECDIAGLFCSPLGECVQCTCDLDCDPAGGLPICYTQTGRCVPPDFCTQPGECTPDTCNAAACACDRRNQICKPFCDQDADCTNANEYCDLNDNVCRSDAERPCDPDDFELNDTREDAIANNIALPVPARGTSVEVPAATDEFLTLCDSVSFQDYEDWFTVTLTRGDKIQIRGTSLTGLAADMTAYGPDGITELDFGTIDDFAPDMIEFTADFDAVYYLQIASEYDWIDSRYSAGEYRLDITNSQGTPCADPFEETHGGNNTPTDATLLNDSSGVPLDCALTAGAIGDTHTIECVGTALNLCLGDVDYYLIDLHAGADLEVILSAFAGNLNLYLYGPFGAADTPSIDLEADSSTSYTSSTETVKGISRSGAAFLLRVARASGDATTYELAVQVNSGPACTEDAYDAPTGAVAGGLPLPQNVDDPDGLNDEFANASFIDIKHPNVGTPTTPKQILVDSDSSTQLNLCRADMDWFRLGTESGGAVVDIPAGIRVMGRLAPINKDVAGDSVTLAAGTAEDEMYYFSQHPTEYLIMDTTGDPYYFLVIGEADNGGVVNYTLEVEYIPPPTCDPDGLGDTGSVTNDAPDDALLLAPGGATYDWPNAIDESESATGLTLCGSDIDWYKIAMPGGASVMSTIRYNPLEADMGLALYNASVLNSTNLDQPGELPDTGLLDDSGFSARGFQRVRGTGAGEIYIMVYNPTSWPLLDYTLEVELISTTCSADPYENNDTWDAATPFTLAPLSVPELLFGVVDRATVCDGDDRDWYSVPMAVGDKVDATYFLDPNEGEIDLYIYAPGPAGVQSTDDYLDWDWDYTTGIATVTYTVQPGEPVGDYLVKVVPWGTGPWSNLYMLEALVTRSCVNDSLEPSSQAFPRSRSVPSTSTDLALCSEEDIYQFTGTGGQVTVCVAFSHAAGDVNLAIYDDPDLTSGVGSSESQTDNEKRVVNTGTGPYYVRVFMPTPGTTTYSLKLANGDASCP